MFDYILFISIVDIRIYLYYFFNTIFFLNIFFRNNTLFIYTSENIPLTIGTIFNVFLGPDKHLEVFKCPVALWSEISEDISPHYIMAVTYF